MKHSQDQGMGARIERRKHERRTPSEPLRVEIGISHEGLILDLSLSGARLEHQMSLRLREPCILRFRVKDSVVALRSQVVWSRVLDRRAGRRQGELMFQSGLAFEEVPLGTKPLLAELVGRELGEAGA